MYGLFLARTSSGQWPMPCGGDQMPMDFHHQMLFNVYFCGQHVIHSLTLFGDLWHQAAGLFHNLTHFELIFFVIWNFTKKTRLLFLLFEQNCWFSYWNLLTRYDVLNVTQCERIVFLGFILCFCFIAVWHVDLTFVVIQLTTLEWMLAISCQSAGFIPTTDISLSFAHILSVLTLSTAEAAQSPEQCPQYNPRTQRQSTAVDKQTNTHFLFTFFTHKYI